MLIPQYSLRWLFGVMTACAGIFTIVAFGVRGHAWAAGLSIALGAFVLAMLSYALLFGLIWTVGALWPRMRARLAGQSPFLRPGASPGTAQADAAGKPAAPIILE